MIKHMGTAAAGKKMTNVLGDLVDGSTRIPNVVISISPPESETTKSTWDGKMPTMPDIRVGDRFHFEAIDGRKGDIRIFQIVPPSIYFSFVGPFE